MGDNQERLVVGEKNTKASAEERRKAPTPSVPLAPGDDGDRVIQVPLPQPQGFLKSRVV